MNKDITQRLHAAGIETARLDAQLLLAHVLGLSRTDVLMMQPEIALSPAQAQALEALVRQREARRPMAHILGMREFWGLEFRVTADTLTPRPDSEVMIETLLRVQPQRAARLKMLDLGTGTGCLLLSALSEYPAAEGLGVDISEAALTIAQENAQKLGLQNRAFFKKSDWNCEVNGLWDVIISNPPYIPGEEIPGLAPEVSSYEPRLALDGGSDGLACYRIITRNVPLLLAKDGVALLEIGQGQAQAVSALALQQGLETAGIVCDLAGIERCVVLKFNT